MWFIMVKENRVLDLLNLQLKGKGWKMDLGMKKGFVVRRKKVGDEALKSETAR